MGFDRAFHAAATYASPEHLDDFRRKIDPAWIEQALATTETATVRRRRLPSEQVVWMVLGMGLFRDRPIEDIVSKLDLALPGRSARWLAARCPKRVSAWAARRCSGCSSVAQRLGRVAARMLIAGAAYGYAEWTGARCVSRTPRKIEKRSVGRRAATAV
jgi:hypothetical protein